MIWRCFFQETFDPIEQDLTSVFAGHGQDILAEQPCLTVRLIEQMTAGLFDEVGLALFDNQYCGLVQTEFDELFFDDRVGNIEHIERNVAVAINGCQTETLKGTDNAVIHAALTNDADRCMIRARYLVQPILPYVILGRRPAVFNLVPLLRI